MGKLISKSIGFLLLISVVISCTEKDTTDIIFDGSVIINSNIYQETITNNYTITSINLNENLLTIKISSSGCSGDSWNGILVDANETLESFPVQRNIKLSLENNEACLAVFEKEFTFDISKLKEGFDQVILNLEGWNSQINYN